MILAKNYEKLSKFVKVTAKTCTVGPFFRHGVYTTLRSPYGMTRPSLSVFCDIVTEG